MAASPDYDALRRPAIDLDSDGMDGPAVRGVTQSPTVDVDEIEGFELSVADSSDEELVTTVIPMLADEFRCPRCFLVHHRSQRATTQGSADVCQDCA